MDLFLIFGWLFCLFWAVIGFYFSSVQLDRYRKILQNLVAIRDKLEGKYQSAAERLVANRSIFNEQRSKTKRDFIRLFIATITGGIVTIGLLTAIYWLNVSSEYESEHVPNSILAWLVVVYLVITLSFFLRFYYRLSLFALQSLRLHLSVAVFRNFKFLLETIQRIFLLGHLKGEELGDPKGHAKAFKSIGFVYIAASTIFAGLLSMVPSIVSLVNS